MYYCTYHCHHLRQTNVQKERKKVGVMLSVDIISFYYLFTVPFTVFLILGEKMSVQRTSYYEDKGVNWESSCSIFRYKCTFTGISLTKF